MELWQYDATDLARLIRMGRASASEAVEFGAGPAAQGQSGDQRVVASTRQARAAAETADAARARGHALPPLHGVPVTIKINVDVAGTPTDNGVVPLKDFIAKEDSPVVANLKHAGAIIIGRTNAPAFSMRIFSDNALHGRTLNPLDPTVTPGGSSGGAGAATATGIGCIAHGNDIGGSVRIPAYCNGVVGLRTGFGRIPSYNATAANAGRPVGGVLMAVQGPHTRSVRDARLALEVMARGDMRDWRWNDVPMRARRPPGRSRSRWCRSSPAARPIRRRPPRCARPANTCRPPAMSARRSCRPTSSAASSCGTPLSPPNRIAGLWPNMQKMGDPDGIAAMRRGSTSTSRSISRPTWAR